MVFWKTLFRGLSTKKMSQKIRYPAAERNKPFILEVLQKHLDPKQPGKVLEVASGSGQHVSYFAKHFPNLTFQPSESDSSLFGSIQEFVKDTPTDNIKPPIKIDVSAHWSRWNVDDKEYDCMISINLIHVSPFNCTVGLFKGASAVLKQGGLLFTYGPYAHNGIITPQSNVDFDKHIKSQNPEWGLRDIVDLKRIANENGIQLVMVYDLPANNKCLVWQNVEKE